MIKHFKAARNAAAPLVAIQTPDQVATIQSIDAELGKANKVPMFVWDAVRALTPANQAGADEIASFGGDPGQMINLTEALVAAHAMPDDAILFLLNAHRHISVSGEHTPNVQAIANLRDEFKKNGRTLVMLAPGIRLPAELETDTLILDEPLPDEGQLATIAATVFEAGEQKEPKADKMSKIVDAVAGLAAFPAEQAMAMSLRQSGMDTDALWERKRQMVEQARGLSVYRGTEKFAAIGGLENLKNFCTRVIGGKKCPRVIVFIDEIEKAMNPDGDLSGVSKDQLGMLLKFMQDNQASGMILVGPPGTAKSMLAKSMGNEAGIPTVELDLGGMKGGIVGESETNIRHGLKVCKAIGGERLLFIATSNNIGSMPPELRRRFTLGTFFMDLPDDEERATIWALYMKAYKIGANQAKPADEGWTGAEIRQCCDLADSLGISLKEAAGYIVPVAKSAAEQIERLRQNAAGRYISASKPGMYENPSTSKVSAPAPAAPGKRRLNVQD